MPDLTSSQPNRGWSFWWKPALFLLVACVGLVASFHTILFAKGRQIYSLSRAGYFPRFLSITHPRHKTPHVALLAGSAVASDAFFPFRDGIDNAAKAGITAVIQPGGSMRDNEVIAAADEAGIAMVFTGMRHFRH